MKVIEKITLVLYSNIMLILAIIACLLIFGWVDIDIVGDVIKNCLTTDPASKISLGVSVVFILLSIRCIFFDPTSREELKEKQGVLLENENGKLMISKETIENLVDSVAKVFENAEEISTKVELDKENNVKIFVNLTINSNAVIKDLSANLQDRIKEKVKKATDLEVKEVNISVKKVSPVQNTEQA